MNLDEGQFYDLTQDFRGGAEEIGRAFGQRVFVTHCRPGARVSLPFSARDFNALVYFSTPQSTPVHKGLGLGLLRHGLRSAVIGGCDAEGMSHTVDELVDEHGFAPHGETVFSLSLEGESIEECAEYALTPNGLADVMLIVLVGDEAWFQESARSISSLLQCGAARTEAALA